MTDGGILSFFVKGHTVHRMGMSKGEVLLYLRHLTLVCKCASILRFPRVFLLSFWAKYLQSILNITFTIIKLLSYMI